MTNKTTKRALLTSIVSLVLCFTMLLGTTYAWFTDSAATANNVITAGNLDIEVTYTLDGVTWNNLDGADDLFQKGLWEPGHTEVVVLKIENKGTLALKYSADINVVDEKVGTTKDGKDIVLSKILTVSTCTQQAIDANGEANSTGAIFPAMAFNQPEGWIGYQTTNTFENGKNIKSEKQLMPKEADYIAVKVDMATTVGNEANHKGPGFEPSINFGINVLATQYTYENDSFGNDYDTYATFPWVGNVDVSWYNDTDSTFEISTAEQLAGLSKLSYDGNDFAGKTITLLNDIDLSGGVWAPIKNFAGEFNGNGKTVSNFVIDGSTSGGLFQTIAAGDGERVHDLTIKGVDATVNDKRFGTLANSVQGIVNRVTVIDINVKSVNSDAWIGGMCAYMSWPWMNDCTVENIVVDATNGAEFVAGFSPILQKNSNMVFTNCDVNGFKVTVSETDGACGVAGFVGQTQRGWENPSLKDCDVTGIDIVATGTVDIGGFMAWPGAHTIAENCTTVGKIDASGVTNATNYVGGFFGNLGWNADLGQMGHKITNCTADVDIISGGAPAGGFVGSATVDGNGSMYATFISCTATGDVTNTNGVAGGFAGVADRGDYDYCSASGTVSGTISGGFIGQIKDVTPKYDSRYPAGTRPYLVDEIFIDNCVGSSGLSLIGQIDTGTDVTIDGIQQ